MRADVAIVGGGPVGLVTAVLAADAGLSVVVVEGKPPPGDKSCGEGIMPAGVALLGDLGIDPPGHAIAGIRYLDGGRSVDALFGDGPGRGVRRTTLQRTLHAASKQRGIPIVGGKVRAVEQSSSGARLLLRGGSAIEASYVVGADGLHSTVRRAAGLAAAPRRLLGRDRPAVQRRHGIRRHYATPPWTDLVEVHWARLAEAYVTPVAPDCVGVAVLTSSPGSFEDHLAGFPALLERLGGAAAASADRGAGPFRQRSSGRVAGRVLLVGDAAGYVDAITGEGLTVGWRMARAAVDAIAAGDLAAYERAWPGIVRRSAWLTHGLVGAARLPVVRRMIVPAASRLPWAFRGLVNLAAHG